MGLLRRFAATPLMLVILAGACGGGRSEPDSTVAAGEAGGIEVDALDYEVTPDRYERWLAAQRALDAIPGLPEPPTLDPSRFTDADINRAVGYLESDPRARAALARAGVSARDYVLTTLALDQALIASTSGGARSGSAGAAAPSSGAVAAGGGATRAADRSAAGAASRPAASGRTRTRYRNVPPRNRDLVERKRDDIARVRAGMRFRIAKERGDSVVVERAPSTPATAPVVPTGTTIALRSDARVCGSTHKAGARVTGTVISPVSGTNGATIPAGASASLSVVGAPRAGVPMEFALNSISFAARTYQAAGTGVTSRVDRVPIGSASRDAQKIAGGAVVGAVAGRVLGKDTKSAVIGAAVGAAAGAAAADASRRYDFCVPAGAPIQVTLRDALTLRV